jgi:hypothetical protein
MSWDRTAQAITMSTQRLGHLDGKDLAVLLVAELLRLGRIPQPAGQILQHDHDGGDTFSLHVEKDAVGQVHVVQCVGNDHGLAVLVGRRRPGLPGVQVHVTHAHALHKVQGVAADHQVQIGIPGLEQVVAGDRA